MPIDFFDRRAREFQEMYGAKVVFEGPMPDRNNLVWQFVMELVLNCVTNRLLENPNAGAKKVCVFFEPGKLTIRDDFVYPNPESVVKFLAQVVASGKFISTKPKGTIGGVGIYSIVEDLKPVNGSLTYHEENGTIVAVVEWDDSKELLW